MHSSASPKSPLRTSLAVGASLAVLAFAQNAQAQAAPCADGTPGPVCVITVTASSSAIVGSNGNATVVTNSGTITGAPAISQGGSPALVVVNEAGGTIDAGSGAAISGTYRLNSAITNRGTINGNVVVSDAPAINIFTAGLISFTSDGGTVNGDVQLGTTGFTRANFVQMGADDGVTGTITAGQGLDVYTRAYAASQALVLGQQVLPATFEIAGYLALNPTTELTLSGTGTTINLSGTGAVVNDGTISPVSTAGLFPVGVTVFPETIGYTYANTAVLRRLQIPLGQAGSFFTVFYGSALSGFTNNGTVNGDINLSTASFTNSGAINLSSGTNGTAIYGAKDTAFAFDNSGDILFTVSGARPTAVNVLREFDDGIDAAVRLRSAVDTTQTADVTIANSGTIEGGIDARFAAANFTFTNSGSISGNDDVGGNYVPGVFISAGRMGLHLGDESRYDGLATTVRNTATGSIDHGLFVYASSPAATVINEGSISSSVGDNTAVVVDLSLDDDLRSADLLAFSNAGQIIGNVELEIEGAGLQVDNTGVIVGTAFPVNTTTFGSLVGGAGNTLDISGENPQGAVTATFINTGSVSTINRAQSGVVVSLEANDAGNPLLGVATATVTNSGTISATGGASIVTRQFAPALAEGEVLVNIIGALVVDPSDSTGPTSATIVNAQGGLIEAGGQIAVITPGGYSPVTTAQPGAFTTALLAMGDAISITNSGTIRGGEGTLVGANIVFDFGVLPDDYLAGAIMTAGQEIGTPEYTPSIDTVTNTATGTIIGSIDLGAGDDTLVNRGSITGDILLRQGNDTLTNYGTLTGEILLGDGNDTFTQGVSAVLQGNVDAETGTDTFNLDLTGGGTIDQTIYDHLFNFEVFNLIGQGQVDVALGDTDDTLANDGTLQGDVNLGGGDNAFTNTGTVQGDITGGEAADEVANDGTIDGSINLGGGNNSFANTGTVTGNVSGGDNADSVENDGDVQGSIGLGTGDNTLTNGGSVAGNVSSGGGNDQVGNAGTIGGNVDLGGGANTFGNTGQVAGNVATGTANDQVSNNGQIGGTVYLDGAPAPAEGPTLQAAIRSLQRVSLAAAPTGGDDVFSNSSLVEGSVFAGAGNDMVTNSGTIRGDVDLGDGNDTLVLQGVWAIGGTASGGAGTDAVTLAMRGGATPQVLDLARFTGFETLGLSGGTGIVTSSMTFGQINVGSGRLIGAAGSTMTGNVAVASGGTFGSAGTVNGNISVASGATLSPGASPAVMTVNGNVSLAAGSTTLFEFVPAPGQSDQLLIAGNLSIASGATLDLTGNRPLTPGIAYDLIVADQITGQFTIGAWDRSLVQGFLRYLDGTSQDRLQLLGTFVFQAPAAAQPTAAVNYVNSLLVAGTASTALNNAIPQLLDASGYASVAAFSLLTPEPYASATQLGVETGLSMAKASRSGLVATNGEEPALFGFGTGFGAWRGLQEDSTLGTSRASSQETGVIGGIGFGNSSASAGAFAGYIEGRQRIGALGAQTTVDGMMAGVAANVRAAGFSLDALAGYHWGKADTLRAVPGGLTVGDDYTLRTLVLDAHAGYAIEAGGLAITPSAGVTHISVRRAAASETASAAFGLNVAGDRHAATFIDGAVELSAASGNAVRPFASVGVRHQIEGDLVFATGSLLGSAATFTVPGAPRKDTVVTAGAGIEADLADNVSVNAVYDGEFGGGSGNAVTVGMRIRF